MKKAFTLMEVLIVIGVLAVLIGIAVPRIKGFQEQAKVKKAKSELKTLESALEAYYMHNNIYPPTTDTVSETYLVNDTNPMIDSVLYDPFGNGTQEYNYLVDGNYWAVSSRGLDRVRNVPTLSDGNLLVAAGVDDLAQTNGIVASCAEGGYTDCGGSCNDLQTDADNCGSCGAAGGPDCCVGAPVDLQTDAANCGTCGNACGDGYACEDGACIDACEAADAGPGTECADGTIYVTATLRTTPSDAGTMKWSTEQIVTGATNDADGEENTTHLMTHSTGTNYPAAEYCAGLVAYDHDDWYLPAKDQMAVFYTYRLAIGEFDLTLGVRYWSSTEHSDSNAWNQYFSSSSQGNNNKTIARPVRCARSP